MFYGSGLDGAFRTTVGAVFTTALFMLLAVSIGATDAGAATRYVHSGQFGSTAELANPQRMAVHQSSGLLFVADRDGNRVRIYEADDEDLLTRVADLTAADRADGADNLNQPSAVAIDQETGELYVAKTGAPAELIRFTPDNAADPRSFVEDETFSSPAGVTWVEAGGLTDRGDIRGGLGIGRDALDQPLIFTADPVTNVIRAFSHSGTVAAVFPGFFGPVTTYDCSSCEDGPFADLVDFSTGPDGSLYAVDVKAGTARLVRIALDGTTFGFDKEWDTGLTAGYPRVAVDQVTEEMFVSDREHFVQIDGPTADDIVFTGPVPPPAGGTLTFAGRTGVALLGTSDPSSGGRLFFGGVQFDFFGPASLFAGLQVYDSAGLLAEPPVVQMDDVAPGDVTATTASLSGQVTPNEEGVQWRFEYRRCNNGTCEEWSAPDSSQPAWQGPIVAGDYGQPQPVSFVQTGLAPNSDYEVRLRATNSRASVASDPVETFETEFSAPGVTTDPAASISAWRATLVGEIDPRNAATLYQFELTRPDGETLMLPAAPASIAADAGASQVTAEATGLDPDRRYSYRLVGYLEADENLRSDGDPVAFTTRPAADSTAPERAYELVSPSNTNAAPADAMMLSPDGDRALFRTQIPLPDSENTGFDWRVSERNADGSWAALPFRAGVPVVTDAAQLDAYPVPQMNASLTQAIFSASGGHDPEDRNGQSDVYRRDMDTGQIRWMSRDAVLPSGETGLPGNTQFVSEDGRQVLFTSARKLAPTDISSGPTLYEWRDGAVRQVAFRPGATTGPTQGSVLGSGIGGSDIGFGELRNAVSRDGRRIVFSITESAGQARPQELYVDDGGDVVEVGVGGATFWGADADVETVVFTKDGDLYDFNLATETAELVHPSMAGGAGVVRALHVSNDGNRIYFISTKDVLGGGHATDPYGLWVAERPDRNSDFEVHYISQVNNTVPQIDTYGTFSVPLAMRQYGADPDGEILAFRSNLNLVPGRKTGGGPQVYVYERDRDVVYCLSCPLDGSAPDGTFGNLQPHNGLNTTQRSANFNLANPSPRVVADDGTVIFETRTPLVPGDTNVVTDIYEWHGGEVTLVSSGRSRSGNLLSDVSTDGQTVIFSTPDDLVDGLPERSVYRVYAARVGGGFTSDDLPPMECRGTECREAALPAPPPQERSSAARRSRKGGQQQAQNCRSLAKRVKTQRRMVRRQKEKLRRLRARPAKTGRLAAGRTRVKRSRSKLTRFQHRLSTCRRAAR